MRNYQSIVDDWRSSELMNEIELDKRLREFRILFAYHSGRLECDGVTYSDTRELFERGTVSDFTGEVRPLVAQLCVKRCDAMLARCAISREPLTVELAQRVHGALTAGALDNSYYTEGDEEYGAFKKSDGVRGSSALKVEMDLGELFDEINSYCGEETMIAAAYLHARFEYIFPFADGNGRVGRALLNYYLITHGHPPLVIFISERELYLDCLARYDEDEELDPLVELLKYETVRTWEGRV